MMDIEKIEGIVAALAKNGDRETLTLVGELLSEVAKFKKKGEKSSLREVVESPRVLNVDSKSHASLILDGLPEKSTYVPSGVVNVENNSSSDMMNHASLLF